VLRSWGVPHPMKPLSSLRAGDQIGHARVISVTSASLPGAKGGKRAGDLGDKFEALWKVWGDPAFQLVREFMFHPERRWRFDLAHPPTLTAIECDGGQWTGGRHVRGKGFQEDAAKRNEAQRLGWAVLVFTTSDLAKKRQADTVDAVLRVLRERATK
jgi:very-short-patch-repair endonuclease